MYLEKVEVLWNCIAVIVILTVLFLQLRVENIAGLIKLVEIRLVWQLISSLDMIIKLVFHNSDQIEECYL